MGKKIFIVCRRELGTILIAYSHSPETHFYSEGSGLSLIIRSVFAILCLFGTYGYGRALVAYTQRQLGVLDMHGTVLAFGVGAFFYLSLWLFFFSKRGNFWSVFEHEMIHAIFALLFFKKVHSFAATRKKGGMVEIEGGNFMIALAPYFFPLVTVLLIGVKPFLPYRYQWILNALVGFTLMFHLVHLTNEFHPEQPDIQRTGRLFSVIVILFFNIFFIGLSIASLDGTIIPMRGFVEMGFWDSVEFAADLFQRGENEVRQRLF